MKRIIAFISVLLIAGMSPVSAQKSFYSGAFVMSINYGVNGNVTSQQYAYGEQQGAQTLNGSAPASVVAIGAEAGLLNWLGIGFIGRVDNYSVMNDQYVNTSPYAGAVDIGGTANIHVLRMKHLDLLGGGDWGFSQITYHLNNGLNTTSSGMGTWSDLHANARFYFEKFGLNFNLFVPTATYRSLQAGNPVNGQYLVDSWKSSGFGASIGMQFRIL